MSLIKNFWKNDAGFFWLLGFTVVFIVMGQLSGGTSTWLTKVLVILEGLLGQLFPAIFIAKLVSHQIEDARK